MVSSTVLGKHVFDRYGNLAGKDEDRAADINEMFANKSVNAIMAMHGGWGSPEYYRCSITRQKSGRNRAFLCR